MVTRSLYLPKSLIERVDRYAEVRNISRNVAFEELLSFAADGSGSLPISGEMLKLAFKEAGFGPYITSPRSQGHHRSPV